MADERRGDPASKSPRDQPTGALTEARKAIRAGTAYPNTPSGRRKALRDEPIVSKIKRVAKRTFTLPSRTLRKVARAGAARKAKRQSGRSSGR